MPAHDAAQRRLGAVQRGLDLAAAPSAAAVEVAVEALPGATVKAGVVPIDRVGTELYNKAKQLIPAGTGLLSKRPEMFLPDQWPSYYSKAQGCFIWDMSGNKYIDMICTPGPYILGAADPDVNAAVAEALANGSFSTLNAPEEVELAELMLELHPWSKGGMVRYARGGGEIDMMAARIARAYTKRDRIAICGYHGWTDWYLAANHGNDSNLEAHLMPGLSTDGVPKGLAGTAVPWLYGKLDELEAIFTTYPDEVACVFMECARSTDPEPGFLEAVRLLCDQHGALLVFDEVSSAWRENCGGRHLKYGVAPDIATFSKTMSNGIAMAAVIGTREVMLAAQDTFISTTYHTERLGPAAALATIKKFIKEDVQAVNTRLGLTVKEGMTAAAGRAGLPIALAGMDCWPSFSFEGWAKPHAAELTTLFTQEMLGRGFLANTAICITFAHKPEHIAVYLSNAEAVFEELAALGAGGSVGAASRIGGALNGPVKHSGFGRLID